MAYDFKKEAKLFYMPKNKPEIVTVPPMNFLAVSGQGDPNEEGGAYRQAVSVLYALAYTLKMSYKGTRRSPDFTNMSCRRWKASGGSRASPVWIIRRSAVFTGSA